MLPSPQGLPLSGRVPLHSAPHMSAQGESGVLACGCIGGSGACRHFQLVTRAPAEPGRIAGVCIRGRSLCPSNSTSLPGSDAVTLLMRCGVVESQGSLMCVWICDVVCRYVMYVWIYGVSSNLQCAPARTCRECVHMLCICHNPGPAQALEDQRRGHVGLFQRSSSVTATKS
eukprot:1703104-Rhodomonas_salina.1